MKITLIAIFSFFTVTTFAKEELAPDSVKISKKIIKINQEALRAPASAENEDNMETETLTEAMEKVEEPKLWFNP